MASLCTDTSPGMSPFVSRQSPHQQLSAVRHYARPDRTQMLLQLLFEIFLEIIQSGLLPSFCYIFFHESVISKTLKLIQIFKKK